MAVGDGDDVSSEAERQPRVDFSDVKNETARSIRPTFLIDPHDGGQGWITTPVDPAPGGFNALWSQHGEAGRRACPLVTRNEKGSVMTSLPLGMIQPSREKPMYTQWPAGRRQLLIDAGERSSQADDGDDDHASAERIRDSSFTGEHLGRSGFTPGQV